MMSEHDDIEIIMPDGKRTFLTGKDARALRDYAEHEDITLEEAINRILKSELQKLKEKLNL